MATKRGCSNNGNVSSSTKKMAKQIDKVIEGETAAEFRKELAKLTEDLKQNLLRCAASKLL